MGTWTNEDLKAAQVTDPIVIHSLGIIPGATGAGVTPLTFVWPVANLAFYIPFVYHNDQTVKRMFVEIGGVQSGNIDVGIYNEAGARQVSDSGSLVGTINDVQEFDIGDTFLVAGRYYMAVAIDNVTASIMRLSILGYRNRILGIKEQTSAYPLPETATFAENVDRSYIPSMAVSLVT